MSSVTVDQGISVQQIVLNALLTVSELCRTFSNVSLLAGVTLLPFDSVLALVLLVVAGATRVVTHAIHAVWQSTAVRVDSVQLDNMRGG